MDLARHSQKKRRLVWLLDRVGKRNPLFRNRVSLLKEVIPDESNKE